MAIGQMTFDWDPMAVHLSKGACVVCLAALLFFIAVPKGLSESVRIFHAPCRRA
jgi:hypothetical protein